MAAMAGSQGLGYGYSRRCPPGDAKSTDRRRLLTDRNAYIAFLEAQAERRDDAIQEVEGLHLDLRQVTARVDLLEERVKDTQALEERLTTTVRSVTNAVERAAGAEEAVGTSCRELQDALRAMESRLHKLEEMHANSDAETARTRNEVTYMVQDLGHRLDERIQRLQSFADETATSVIREAQMTCVRLADDAMCAAEASQQKLEEYQRRTDANFEVLRVDLTGLRAEIAGDRSPHAMRQPSALAAAEPQAFAGVGTAPGDRGAGTLADEIEARLGARIGQQVLQMSEVLRRVIQAQTAIHQQLSGKDPHAGFGGLVPHPPVQPVDECASIGATAAGGGADERRRSMAIDELYRELRELERNESRPNVSSSRRGVTKA